VESPSYFLAIDLGTSGPKVALLSNGGQDAVDEARNAGGGATTGAAPMYCMAATLSARSVVREMIARYIDRIYDVEDE
jgi:sugar (pentulose or hexulose) kinase